MKKYINLDERIVTDGVSKQGFTFYHRTGGSDVVNCVKTIKGILQTGFKPGSGDMYGKGMYGTTDRKSSFQTANVHSYGLGLIKYLVPIKGVLVFDYNLSALLFGTGTGPSGNPAYSLEDQLVRYGIFKAGKIPEVFQVLSWDLEKTFGASNRTISADRAYNIFVRCLIKGQDLYSCAKDLTRLEDDLLDSYKRASSSSRVLKNFDRFKGVNGIVFSGNHDGNVIVMYKFYNVKPLMWGVSDPGDIGNPTAWAVPMQPCAVNSNPSISDLSSMLTDMISDEGLVSKKGALDNIYVEGMELGTLNSIVKNIQSLAPWIKNNLNAFSGIGCAVPSARGKPSVIFKGTWLQGTFDGYFGGNSNGDDSCIKLAESIIGKPLPAENYDPVFTRGTFSGILFTGKFSGGVFASGQFEGIFISGLWKWGPNAVWGKNAVFVSSPSHYIEYKGKIYDLDTDPVSWVKRKEAIAATPGGAKNLVDPTLSLEENIENSLPYKATIRISNNWGPSGSIEDKFKLIRKEFAWLWTRLRFSQPPEIGFSKAGCVFENGSLTTGRVSFDVYEKNAIINGGVIEGDNVFLGEMRAGIYSKGHFQGKWYGGVWNEKDCIWHTGMADFIPGATIGSTKVLATTTILIGGSKKFDIVAKAYEQWSSIPELIDAIKSGAYGQLISDLKKNGKPKAPKASKKYGTQQYTPDELAAIVNDDDDSDDSNVFSILHKKQDSVKNLSSSLNEFFNSRSRNRALLLAEKEYRYGDLTDLEQDRLYQEFKDTYEKATGAAFSRSAFDWRADNWTFYGDSPDENNPSAPCGGVAVRKQMSNDMYKLVASFGAFRSVLKGFIELNQKHGKAPIWGVVTPEIKKMVVRGNKDYVSLPGVVVKAMEPILKKLSNGSVKSVSINGDIKVDTPAGIISKVFICNKNYVRWLIDAVEDPAMQSKLPIPQEVIKPLIGMVKALL